MNHSNQSYIFCAIRVLGKYSIASTLADALDFNIYLLNHKQYFLGKCRLPSSISHLKLYCYGVHSGSVHRSCYPLKCTTLPGRGQYYGTSSLNFLVWAHQISCSSTSYPDKHYITCMIKCSNITNMRFTYSIYICMCICYVYLCTYLYIFFILFCVDGCFACIDVYVLCLCLLSMERKWEHQIPCNCSYRW